MGELHTNLSKSPEYKQIFDALKPYLDSGVRQIHIWDGNHMQAAPRQIFADKGLYELVAPYGKPLYVSEALSATNKNGVPIVDAYRNGDKAQRSEVFGIMFDLANSYGLEEGERRRHAFANVDILELARSGDADAFGPDMRFTNKAPKFTPDEQRLVNQFVRGISAAGGSKALENGYTQTFMASLSSEEKLLFDTSVYPKIMALATNGGKQLADLTAVDAQIAKRVQDYSSEHPASGVQINLYGVLHYAKTLDLDEHMKGVSLAVMDRPAAFASFGTTQDVPDLVFYTDENRLVKLDTPQAVAEFKGDVSRAPVPQVLHTNNTVARLDPSQTDTRHSGSAISGGQECTMDQVFAPCTPAATIMHAPKER